MASFRLKSLGTALVIALALYLAVVAFAVPATMVMLIIAVAVLAWGAHLYRKLCRASDPRAALLQVTLWLALALVVLPNVCMGLLLFTSLGHGGGPLQLLGYFLVLFAFLFASPYYWIPSALFGESYFLQETVVSPHGWAGIGISALFWILIVFAVMAGVHFWAQRGGGTGGRSNA